MFSLNYYALLSISVFAAWLMYFLKGYYSRNMPDTPLYAWRFTFHQDIACLLTIICIYASSDMFGRFSWFSFFLGILLGIVNASILRTQLKAYSLGAFSYTSIIISLSALIPTLSGLFFGETISLWQYLGIVLMALCIILSPAKKDDANEKKASLIWIVVSICAAILVGTTGVIQKIHQSSLIHREEMSVLLITGFTVSAILSGSRYFTEKRKSNVKITEKYSRCAPVLSGMAFAFPHTINLFLSGRLSAVVLFPLVSLTQLILLTLSGVIIFKEKLSFKNWVGLILGILSTLLVSNIIK